jgi:hypothetical protein
MYYTTNESYCCQRGNIQSVLQSKLVLNMYCWFKGHKNLEFSASIGKRTFGNVVASCKSKALLSSYPLSCRLRNAMLLRELETLSQIQLPDMLNLQLSYQQYPNVSIITLVSMSFDKS